MSSRLEAEPTTSQPSGEGPQIRFDWTEPFHDGFVPEVEGGKAAADFASAERIGLSPLASSDGDIFDLQQDASHSEQQQEGPPNNTSQKQQPQSKRGISDILPEAPSRRKKKPKSLPKRPLSAYNLYFQQVRADLNAEGNAKVGFHDLGKIVGKKWKALAEVDRNEFQDLARQDSERYRREMDEHKKREAAKKEEAAALKLSAESSFPPPPQDDRNAPISGNNYVPPYGAGPLQNFGPSYGNLHSYQYPSYAPPPQPYQNMPPPNAWGGPPSQFHPPSYAFDGRGGGGPNMQPSLMEGQPKDGRPLPPGSEVRLRDPVGEFRTYTVQYAMVTMSRQEAKDYMERLKRS